MNLRICLWYRINVIWSCSLWSLIGIEDLYICSKKNGIQLSSLNIVNVPVVLMHTALFCIRKTLSSNFFQQDYQIGLRYNITGFITLNHWQLCCHPKQNTQELNWIELNEVKSRALSFSTQRRGTTIVSQLKSWREQKVQPWLMRTKY